MTMVGNEYNQSLLNDDVMEVNEEGRRWIGWSFRLRSLRIDVLGCHSRKPFLSSAISCAKK